jgi:hypothetical protein
MTANYALAFHMRHMFNTMENAGCFRSATVVAPVSEGYQIALEAQKAAKEKKEQIDINRGLVSDFS